MKVRQRCYLFAILSALLALLSFTGYAHRQIASARGNNPNITWRETIAAVLGGKPTAAKPPVKPGQPSSADAAKTGATPDQAVRETLNSESAGKLSPAQSGGPYDIVKSVIPGGGDTSLNGGTSINGSLGQPAVDISSGGSYTISSGFWPGGGCPTITVTPPTLPNGQLGTPYSQTLTQTGGVGTITWSVSLGSLPGGLMLAPATGILSGTPAASGSFNFTARATDANNCFGERAYTLEIGACPVITIAPATLPNGLLGMAYDQTLTASGGTPPYTFTLDAGSLPAGLNLATSGALTGTPTTSGSFPFTVRATDLNGCAATRPYTLVICATITVNPVTLPNGFVGTAYSQMLTQTGGSGAINWSIHLGTLPGGLNLDSVSGLLSGTPTATGTFNFTVRATDTNGCFGERPYAVIVSGSGLMFYPLAHPVRLLETRPGYGACFTPGAPVMAGATRTQPARGLCDGLTIPDNAAAITGNITVVPAEPGYLTLFPGDAVQPTVANSNFNSGEITNNVFTVGLAATGPDAGAFKIFTSATTEVIVDLTGYYAPPSAGGLYFHSLPEPIRLLETRAGYSGCFAPGTPLTGTGDLYSDPALDLALQGRAPLPCPAPIPAQAQMLVGNATSVLPSGGGFLIIYPSGGTRPVVASSNYAGGDVINGPFTVKLGADGQFKVYTFANTHLVIDILGYYSAEAVDANGAGLLFTPLAHPVRLLETRPDFPGYPLTGCFRTNAPIPGGAGGIRTQPAWGTCDGLTVPTTARAIIGNATVINPVAEGYLTFYPGDLGTAPTVATSNYPFPVLFGYNRHYFVGLSPADGTFKMLTQWTTDLIVDVSGYFAP